MSSSPTYRDHFSSRAHSYAKARPTYPPELSKWLAEQCEKRVLCWEAGCGSGQLTHSLAAHFEQVIATDASPEQLAQATALANVVYQHRLAHQGLDHGSQVDLAVAAQAAHWFDLPAYYATIRRVLAPGGLVALICYSRCEIDEKLDQIVDAFHQGQLATAWPPERQLVDSAYSTLDFPFRRLVAPIFFMHARWDLQQFLAYVDTWSAIRVLEKRGEAGKFTDFCRRVEATWGPTDQPRTVRWPLTILAGRTDD